MCYAKPGPRCSAHVREQLVNVENRLATASVSLKSNLSRSARVALNKEVKALQAERLTWLKEWDATPEGMKALEDQMKNASNSRERDRFAARLVVGKRVNNLRKEALSEPDIYRSKRLEIIAENLLNTGLPQSLDDFTPELSKRVETEAERLGMDPLELKKEMIVNPTAFYLTVLKSPEKQGYHEKVLISYLTDKVKSLNNVRNLVNSGTGAMWLRDGKVSTSKGPDTIKSLDFAATTTRQGKTWNVYGICKYTQGAGGAQDNQRNDVITALEQVKEDSDFLVVATLDGSYWDSLRFGKVNRENLAAQFAHIPNIIVSDYHNLDAKIKAWQARG